MKRLLVFAAIAAGVSAGRADAHFLYVLPPGPGESRVRLTFGESAQPADSEAMLKYVEDVALVGGEGPVELMPDGGVMAGEGSDAAVYTARKSFGVMNRGEETFRLEYYAKGGPSADSSRWQDDSGLRLDVRPEAIDGGLRLTVLFDGRPAAGAEGVYETAGQAGFEDADDAGVLVIGGVPSGLFSCRAKWTVDESGELEGQSYAEVRHYSTLVLHVPAATDAPAALVSGGDSDLPPLPQPVTSFGAARLGDTVYAYGGHTGDAHSYSREEQASELWALDLTDPSGGWKTVARGATLQGNALVAAADRVVLLGGFTARNAEGEEHDLHSLAEVRAFDPRTGQWTDLPPLPEPRSSFDAAAAGSVITVCGGWSMAGDADAVWHASAYSIDLSDEQPRWTVLSTPPMKRRALATVAHDAKVYVLGGMSESYGPTTAVTVYDSDAKTWSEGPPLPGDAMNGFGCGGFVRDDRLYASTFDGGLHRLSEDGTAWQTVGQMPRRRFFHRFVPLTDGRVLILGGGEMSVGKYPEVDVLTFAEDPAAP